MGSGYFVDWNGNTRRIGSPGDGYTCKVVVRQGLKFVDVIDSAGFVCHEADYHESIASLEQAGVVVSIVP